MAQLTGRASGQHYPTWRFVVKSGHGFARIYADTFSRPCLCNFCDRCKSVVSGLPNLLCWRAILKTGTGETSDFAALF
jgi:hypothetical protein